jgi:2'-5' RNA ligase
MSLRLFAALALPDDVADRVVSLQAKLPGAHWRPRENLHLTLCFYGDVAEPQAEELDAALEEVSLRHGPFDLALRAAGSFGGADPHTLWIGVEKNEALERLAAACAKAGRLLGLKLEARKYAPHVTLAYLRGAENNAVQTYVARLGLFSARAFRVEGFSLYSSAMRKSAPSLYRPEADYVLGG